MRSGKYDVADCGHCAHVIYRNAILGQWIHLVTGNRECAMPVAIPAAGTIHQETIEVLEAKA